MLRKLAYGFIGLLATGLVAYGAVLPYPAVNGPYLGDQLNNLYTITQALITMSGFQSSPGLSVSQTVGQANCTQLNASAMQEVKTSASTGYICLPPAFSGKEVNIGNATTQTIDIYSSANGAVSGTADTINGTAGSTPYTGLTSGKNASCFAPANGAWYCGSGN